MAKKLLLQFLQNSFFHGRGVSLNKTLKLRVSLSASTVRYLNWGSFKTKRNCTKTHAPYFCSVGWIHVPPD